MFPPHKAMFLLREVAARPTEYPLHQPSLAPLCRFDGVALIYAVVQIKEHRSVQVAAARYCEQPCKS